jgi:hypothetical protein
LARPAESAEAAEAAKRREVGDLNTCPAFWGDAQAPSHLERAQGALGRERLTVVWVAKEIMYGRTV